MANITEIDTSGRNGWGYTEEEVLLRQNLRAFVEKEVAPRWEEGRNFDTEEAFFREMHKKLGDMDILRIFAPVESGGLAQRLTNVGIILEELARGSAALSMHVMVNILESAWMGLVSKAAYEKWAPGIISGDIILAGCGTAPEGMANYPEQASLGRLDEKANEWVLDGQRAFSSGGQFCDVLLISGITDEGDSAMWFVEVEKTPGLTITHNPEMAVESTYGTVDFKNVRVPKEFGGLSPMVRKRKPQEFVGFKTFAVMCDWMNIGTTEAVFEKTVEYMKNRTSYFKPLASKGLIQYKLTTMKAKLVACRAMATLATQLIEHGDPAGMLVGDLSKAYVNDTCRMITDECIQMHGNLGINPKSGIIHHHLETIGFSIGAGTSDMHYDAAAALMGLPEAEFVAM
ncbi:MAG: acyl-CoA/acyl-ACP dehydrogenase [Gracilibacteraceae bacterium]|jgi:alkylation response protein AidB-like acyl-CoA dehydrogenase|nr:acyl-CoA/acyl-ACP dehydrogenase [Gracilibacteraceae bacterium]